MNADSDTSSTGNPKDDVREGYAPVTDVSKAV